MKRSNANYYGLGVLAIVILIIIGTRDRNVPREHVATASAPTPAAAIQPVAQPEKPATPADRATDLEDYLRDNFSDTSWYPHISAVRVMSGAAWIDTDIYPDKDAREPAASICMAVSGYVYSNQDSLSLTGLRVAASTGERLAMRTSISDRC